MADTDERTLSIATYWSPMWKLLSGTAWEAEDIEDAIAVHVEEKRHHSGEDVRLAALALKYVYDKIVTVYGAPVDPEQFVLATLKATREMRNSLFISPADVCMVADNFSVRYGNMDQPIQDHLDDYYGKLNVRYLNAEGRKEIEDSVIHQSEIWIDETEVRTSTLTGVWVFNNPQYNR